MNETQREKVLEKLRAKKAVVNRIGEIQKRLEDLLKIPEVLEYTSLTAELEACKKTMAAKNPVAVDKCTHEVVLFDRYEKTDQQAFSIEETDPHTETATYYCLDCGAEIKAPVRYRDLIFFETSREVINDGEQNFSSSQIEALLNYYRSLLESHSAEETVQVFKGTHKEVLSSKQMN